MSFFKRLASFFVLITILVTSCSKPEPKVSDDPAFAKYVSAYTYGVIPSGGQIVVKVTDLVSEVVDVNEEVSGDVLTFEPNIEGEAVWADAHTLVFTPESRLPSGTIFKAVFHLDELLAVESELSEFMFSFQTITQGFNAYVDGLNAVENTDLKQQELKGRVEFADEVDLGDLEEFLIAKQDGRNLEVNFEGNGKSYGFTVKGVDRKEEASKVFLHWKGERFNMDDSEEEFEVPSLNDFSVTSVKLINFPKQVLKVWFSDPLKDQDLAGLITLDKDNNLRFDISGNVVTVYPSSRISGSAKLTVSEGILNSMGYRLKQTQVEELTFEELKPSVELLSEGTIMPSSNGLIIPFKSVNLEAVDVFVTEVFSDNMLQFLQRNNLDDRYLSYMNEVGRVIAEHRIQLSTQTKNSLKDWNNFYVDLSEIIEVKPGTLYNVEIRFKKDFSLYNCGEDGDGQQQLKGIEVDASATGWEDSFYAQDRYWEYSYNWRERNNPCHLAYFQRDRCLKSQLLLASDIGLMAKAGADGTLHLFANDIVSTKPLSGVIIEVYDYQQQLLASSKTDGEGMLSLQLDTRPFVAKAMKGNEVTYLKLDPNQALSTSKFDVSGSYVRGGIKGLIYGERGVWRPGDTLFLTFVLEDAAGLIPENHPVIFELENPQGVTVDRIVRTSGVNGVYSFKTKTGSDAETGNYLARVQVGNRTFSRSIKIETVKPNRLKVELDFGDRPIRSTHGLRGDMDVRWLHGAKVSGSRAVVDMVVERASTRFDGYSKYTFDNYVKRFDRDEINIFDGSLDENGHADIDPEMSFDGAPGFLKVSFNTKAFEPGGDFSVDYYSTIYSPFSHYVGVHVPKGDLWYGTLSTGVEHEFELASVSEEGEATDNRKVSVKVYKLGWRWWWDQYDGELANFTSSSSTTLVQSETLYSKDGKARFKFKANKYQYGRYLVLAEDLESGHSATKVFYADQPYDQRTSSRQTEFATMLTLSSDKEGYQVGDRAIIKFPSSEDSRVLVSIENGTEILQREWIETKEGESTYELDIVEGMAPNVYVHLTMLQPHERTSNDRPIRLYGILPLLVEDAATKLEPVIATNEEWRPESTQEICVSEKNGKAMTYTLAVVDDGLLDLTRFRTPRIWDYFYAKEALGVRTWDMYDEVVGAFGASLMKALGIGGDDEETDADNKNANRFKPMVRYYGPFVLEAGDKACHRVDVPNYIGSVRVMVVASDREAVAYGSEDETVPVRNPLMVLGTLPRVAGPSEDIRVPVSVFAAKDYIKDVDVKISTNDMFTIQGSKTQKVHFKKPGEQLCYFSLKASDRLGIAKVKLEVTSGSEKAYYEVEMDVRASNPPVNDIEKVVLQPGESYEGAYDLNYLDGTNGLNLEVSSLPAIDLEKRLNYLIRYPHGCVEQTTSAAFPQIYLSRLIELDNDQKIAVDNFVNEALRKLVRFQHSEGGFSYWPGAIHTNDWGSSYAGHFIVEAEKAGYTVPVGMKDRWLYYQKRTARSWNTSTSTYAYHRTYQAYRLYTLANANEAILSQMNALRAVDDLPDIARWYLAGAYQLAGQPEAAAQLIEGLAYKIPSYRELTYTYGSNIRDEAVILQVLTSMGKRKEAFEVATAMADYLSSDRYMSTQSTAYALLAMSNFVGEQSDEDMQYEYAYNGKAMSVRTSSPFSSSKLYAKGVQSKHTLKVTNTSESEVFLSVTQSGIPITDTREAMASHVNLDVRYEDKDGASIDPKRLVQGQDFKAVVTVSNPGTYDYLNELSISQIFPSGWEIGNLRMMEGSAAGRYTYQDIRDDRVYTYLDLGRNETMTIEIPLTATYVGRFFLPLVLVEAMYDEDIQARNSGYWVEVVSE